MSIFYMNFYKNFFDRLFGIMCNVSRRITNTECKPSAVKSGRMLNQGNRDCLIRAYFRCNRRFPPVAFAFKNRDVIDREIFDKVQLVHNLKRLCHYACGNIPI